MTSVENNGISSLFNVVNRISSQTVDAGTIRERRLSNENRSLSQANTRLVSENLQLETRKNSLESENRDLRKEVDQLETEVGQLDQQLSESERAQQAGATTATAPQTEPPIAENPAPSITPEQNAEPGRIINTYA